MIDLKSKKAWIFDMDGTLTVPKHDFMEIMDELGIPYDQDIITFIESKEKTEATRLHRKLDEIEQRIALLGEAQPACITSLRILQKRGCLLGIVTRNNRANTETTLLTAGLIKFFSTDTVMTRESAAPKPKPDALHQLLEHWGVAPSEAVMVGDYKYDIEAGKAASVDTIFFDSHNLSQWSDIADLTVTSWGEILRLID